MTSKRKIKVGDFVTTGAPTDRWYSHGKVLGIKTVGPLWDKQTIARVQHQKSPSKDFDSTQTYGLHQLTKATKKQMKKW